MSHLVSTAGRSVISAFFDIYDELQYGKFMMLLTARKFARSLEHYGNCRAKRIFPPLVLQNLSDFL